MAYRRYSRSRSSAYGRRRSTRTRSRRRKSMRGRASQRIVIQVIGGGAAGAVPIAATVAKKGVRPLRRRF